MVPGPTAQAPNLHNSRRNRHGTEAADLPAPRNHPRAQETEDSDPQAVHPAESARRPRERAGERGPTDSRPDAKTDAGPPRAQPRAMTPEAHERET